MIPTHYPRIIKTDLMKKISCTNSWVSRVLPTSIFVLLFAVGGVMGQSQTISTTLMPGGVSVEPSYQTTISMSGLSAFSTITAVSLRFEMDHAWSNDLDISLTAPDGTFLDVCSDQGGSCDWVATKPMIFNDTAAMAMLPTSCTGLDVCPTDSCETRMETSGAASAPAVASDWNGDWTLDIVDDFPFDNNSSALNVLTLAITFDQPDDTTCVLVCPPTETISLDPGECFAPYNYELALVGGLPGCELNPDPIPGFQGAFDFAAGNFCQNCPSNALGFATTTCWISTSVDEFVFGTSDFFNCNCCPFFGTIQQWNAPEDITITFDYEYVTADASPAMDPFGYTVGTDWNGVVATVANLHMVLRLRFLTMQDLTYRLVVSL